MGTGAEPALQPILLERVITEISPVPMAVLVMDLAPRVVEMDISRAQTQRVRLPPKPPRLLDIVTPETFLVPMEVRQMGPPVPFSKEMETGLEPIPPPIPLEPVTTVTSPVLMEAVLMELMPPTTETVTNPAPPVTTEILLVLTLLPLTDQVVHSLMQTIVVSLMWDVSISQQVQRQP